MARVAPRVPAPTPTPLPPPLTPTPILGVRAKINPTSIDDDDQPLPEKTNYKDKRIENRWWKRIFKFK